MTTTQVSTAQAAAADVKVGQPIFFPKRGWLTVTYKRVEDAAVVLCTETSTGIPDVHWLRLAEIVTVKPV